MKETISILISFIIILLVFIGILLKENIKNRVEIDNNNTRIDKVEWDVGAIQRYIGGYSMNRKPTFTGRLIKTVKVDNNSVSFLKRTKKLFPFSAYLVRTIIMKDGEKEISYTLWKKEEKAEEAYKSEVKNIEK